MTKTTWIILAGVAFSVASLVLLQEILFPFIAAFAIAYLLDPLCDTLEEWGLHRTIATCAIMIGFFTLLVAFIGLVVPIVYGELLDLIRNMPYYWDTLKARLNVPLLQELQQLQTSSYSKDVATFLLKQLQSFKVVFNGVGVAFNILSLWLITPLVAFYLLRDWDKLVAYIDSLIPQRHSKLARSLAKDIDSALSNYVRGQLSVCIILGVALGIGLWLLGVPYGFVIGLVSGLLSFIPYLGQLLGGLVAVSIAYVTTLTWELPLAVVALFAVSNILEGSFLTPYFVGQSIGLPAVWAIFALLAGGALFGFVGLLLALPMTACLSVLVKFALQHYRQGSFYNRKK